MDDIILDPNEASKGAFQAIKKVRGVLAEMKRVPSPFESDFSGGEPSDRIQITLEDAEILEMDEGEPEPELRDGQFTFSLTYAKPGKPKAHQNTFYVKGFLTTGKALGIFPDYKGKLVTLERQVVELFKQRDRDTKELVDITQESFVFVEDGGEALDMSAYVIEKLTDKAPHNALRTALMDNKIKYNEDVVAAVRAKNFEALNMYLDEKGTLQPYTEEGVVSEAENPEEA